MKVTFDKFGESLLEEHATVFVVSDSLGESANSVVLSAAAQFSDGVVHVVRLSQIESAQEVEEYLNEHDEEFTSTAVFHSIVDPMLRRDVRSSLNARGVLSVDILGPVVQLLAGLTGEKPKNQARAHHVVDSRYLRRMEAMDFFMDHDEGKNPQDLPEADVVLVGITGSAKSPLAMKLSFLGYKVASVSLDPGSEIPTELASVPKNRVFGLMNSDEGIMKARLRSSEEQDSDLLERVENEQAYAAAKIEELCCECLKTSELTVEELCSDIVARIESE